MLQKSHIVCKIRQYGSFSYKRVLCFEWLCVRIVLKYYTVMTENRDNDASPVSTGKDLRSFVDYVDHPLLAVCRDTTHVNICNHARSIGQYKNITDIGNKLKGLHISDNFGDCHHHS